jgi:hypothetical protein
MSTITRQNLFDHLLAVVPEFKSLYDESVKEFGDDIRHPIMADFAGFVEREYAEHREGGPEGRRHREVVERALAALETAIASADEGAADVIALSFLEGLTQTRLGKELAELMGPNLTRELRNLGEI